MGDVPAAAASKTASPQPIDQGRAMQGVLILEIVARLAIWSLAMAVTLWLGRNGWHQTLLAWELTGGFATAWTLSATTAKLILLYNAVYLLILFVLRLPIPTPRAGFYPVAGGRPDVNLLYSCLIAILTKARYQPPFPAFLVPHLANIFPFHALLGWKLGPHSRTPFFVEPNVIDPWGLTIGRNVVIGFGTTLSSHLQEKDGIRFAPTIIEDDVVIGAHTGIPGNVHIKRGAMVRGYSMVLPGTVISENEYWGGIPARRLRESTPSAEPRPA